MKTTSHNTHNNNQQQFTTALYYGLVPGPEPKSVRHVISFAGLINEETKEIEIIKMAGNIDAKEAAKAQDGHLMDTTNFQEFTIFNKSTNPKVKPILCICVKIIKDDGEHVGYCAQIYDKAQGKIIQHEFSESEANPFTIGNAKSDKFRDALNAFWGNTTYWTISSYFQKKEKKQSPALQLPTILQGIISTEAPTFPTKKINGYDYRTLQAVNFQLHKLGYHVALDKKTGKLAITQAKLPDRDSNAPVTNMGDAMKAAGVA